MKLTEYGMWWKPNKDVTNGISVFSVENDIELSWLIRLSVIYVENKTRQWWNQIIGVVYVENDTKLLWPIKSSANCEEKYTGQWCDQSYKSSLLWNLTLGTYMTR